MIDFELTSMSFLYTEFVTMGEWLDKHMPNPPLPETQRWTMGYDKNNSDRYGIKFENDYDATVFALRWLR